MPSLLDQAAMPGKGRKGVSGAREMPTLTTMVLPLAAVFVLRGPRIREGQSRAASLWVRQQVEIHLAEGGGGGREICRNRDRVSGKVELTTGPVSPAGKGPVNAGQRKFC